MAKKRGGEMKEDIINQFVLWKPIKIVSVITYLLVLVVFPFSRFWAMILLFGLICFWSRIPCLISMFTKDLEVIDFFAVMLALHVGGLFAGVFAASIMLFSRLFGPNEWYLFTIKDAICLFLCSLLTPLFFSWTGNALHTIYLFTAFRYVFYLALTVVLEPEYIGLEIGLCITGAFVAYVSNTLMMKYFEGPLSTVLSEGVQFNFGLFLFTTLVLGFFYLMSRAAKWLEVRRLQRVEKGEEPEEKPAWYELDMEAKKMPLFVKTS